jgi:hypothetical protein
MMASRALRVVRRQVEEHTQWKKSTRASEAGTVRPFLLTSSPHGGTSGSWQSSANNFGPADNPARQKLGDTWNI